VAGLDSIQALQAMKGPFAYSNGWGHLIITIFFGILGTLLILLPTADPTSRGLGVALLTTASGAWFIPGAAKQVVNQVTKQSQGVQGEQGVQGVQGMQGIQGVQGHPAPTNHEEVTP
jgi:uncharacterized membrane protein HdeD (DUF308 family)